MNLNHYARQRDENERALVDALTEAGFLVFRQDRLCDLIVCDPATRIITLIEVKNPRTAKTPRLTREQRESVALGWPVQIVTTPAEALAAVRRRS